MIVWANLDAEARWAGITLPKAVLERLAALAPLLGALADGPVEGPVEVFAPAAVDPARVKLANVVVRTGVPSNYDLAWAQPSAKAANDRRLNLHLHERLGTLLPGQRVVTSVDELDAARGKWVCKAPWTAAGRDRAYGDGAPIGDNRIYVTRLLERFGALLFEPWCERLFDVGVCAHTDGRKHAPHTLLSDARGGFVGIDLAPPPLSLDETAQLDGVVDEARAELLRERYAGPFSVDAFIYAAYRVLAEHMYERKFGDGYFPTVVATFLDRAAAEAFIAAQPSPPAADMMPTQPSPPEGTMPIIYSIVEDRQLHAPCEINARYTFGHVAHALAARYGAIRLGFGEVPPGATVLVEGGAWLASF
jgi:hypothetical protein